MKVLRIIKDSDIGESFPIPSVYRERRASRAIVFDREDRIALLNVTRKGYHKLPGGGIEDGEDIPTALNREMLEEIGCSIGNLREVGIIEEYRNNYELHQISYCFIADLVGEKGSPNLEEGEIADGFEPVWMRLEEAVRTLRNETGIRYGEKFMCLRDLVFLQEALKATT